jgi:hypothetical protein
VHLEAYGLLRDFYDRNGTAVAAGGNNSLFGGGSAAA